MRGPRSIDLLGTGHKRTPCPGHPNTVQLHDGRERVWTHFCPTTCEDCCPWRLDANGEPQTSSSEKGPRRLPVLQTAQDDGPAQRARAARLEATHERVQSRARLALNNRFVVGDRVIVARILDDSTSDDLLGRLGTVEEIDQPSPWQRNYEVRLDDTGSQHYLNDQMLEAYG